MFNIFKYIRYALKTRQKIESPQELLAETSLGLIEGFFMVSFIILGILGFGSLFIGYNYGYIFFQIFGIILLIVLFIDLAIYFKIKKFIERISSEVTHRAKQQISNYRTVDVEATDVQS